MQGGGRQQAIGKRLLVVVVFALATGGFLPIALGQIVKSVETVDGHAVQLIEK